MTGKLEKFFLQYKQPKLLISQKMEAPNIHREVRIKRNSYIQASKSGRTKKNPNYFNFLRDFSELLGNAVHGNTIESVRNRLIVNLTISDNNGEKHKQ